MDIPGLFGRGDPVFSFEFFLPKAPENLDAFLNEVARLKALRPSFITLTYGAGGSARERTVETAGRLKRETGLETVCHLTGITHSRDEISAILGRLRSLGISHIVALRGDPPKDRPIPPPHERDFGYGRDLVEFIKSAGGFRTAVAGYPETHPEAASAEEDLLHLAEKVRAGGDWVITQLFFDNSDYFRFVKSARQAGITAPIVPGIMPVTNVSQLKRFTSLCGAKIPAVMARELESRQDDPEAVIRYGIEHSLKQCLGLLQGGAPGIHFYTLNRSRSTSEILARLREAL